MKLDYEKEYKLLTGHIEMLSRMALTKDQHDVIDEIRGIIPPGETGKPQLVKKCKWISRNEAANILGVDPQTISNYAANGIIHERNNRSHCFYPQQEVEALSRCAGIKETEEMQKEVDKMHDEIKHRYTFTSREFDARRSMFYNNFGDRSRWERYSHIVSAMVDVCTSEGLTGRERDIVKMVLDCRPMDDICRCFGLTYERIRCIFMKAVKKMEQYPEIVQQKIEQAAQQVAYYFQENQRLHRELLANELSEKTGNTVTEEDLRGDAKFKTCPPFTTKIGDLCISVRLHNCLKATNIETIGDIVAYPRTDYMKLRNFGRKTLAELEELLEKNGLQFGMWTNHDCPTLWDLYKSR